MTDNGTEFTNKICKTLHETYDCKLVFATPYHPQTNGLTESSHKAIKQALVKSLNQKNEKWSQFLEEITFSINIRPRTTTKFSAFELMHGCRKPRLPIQAQIQAHEYPEDTPLDQWAEDDQIEELVDFMQENLESNTQRAGEQLIHSQKLMKQQFEFLTFR